MSSSCPQLGQFLRFDFSHLLGSYCPVRAALHPSSSLWPCLSDMVGGVLSPVTPWYGMLLKRVDTDSTGSCQVFHLGFLVSSCTSTLLRILQLILFDLINGLYLEPELP